MTAQDVKRALLEVADPSRAGNYARFFKTAPGEYGAGDKFLGIRVPVQRSIARTFRDLPLSEIAKLLASAVHEDRFTALEILVMRYESSASSAERKNLAKFYLQLRSRINNWDLVDTSAPYILGHYLFDKDKKVLIKLAQSANIWERRIATVATQYFINKGRYVETLALAKILLKDKNDLVQKATGWMLREVGKKDVNVLEEFLTKNAARMSRTTLRYAIERFPETKRKKYLARF